MTHTDIQTLVLQWFDWAAQNGITALGANLGAEWVEEDPEYWADKGWRVLSERLIEYHRWER